MPRILRSYTRDNFEFGDSYTRFTAKFFEPRDNSAPKSAPKNSLKSGLKSGLKKSNNHLPKSLIIYELIKTTPEITILSICEKTGLSRNGVKKNLDKLKEMNLIRRVGPDKGGHWEILQ